MPIATDCNNLLHPQPQSPPPHEATDAVANGVEETATDIEMSDVEKARENSQRSAATDSQSPSRERTRSVSMNANSIVRRIEDDDERSFADHLSIYTDRRCLLHAIPDDTMMHEFNERPQRLEALLQMVEDEGWSSRCRYLSSLDSVPSMADIEGYHKSGYLADLKNSCSKIYEANWNVAQGSDTYVVKHTLDAALVSAGLVMQATKYVFSFFDDTADEMQVDVSPNGHDEQNANNNTNAKEEMDENQQMEVDEEVNANGDGKVDADAHKMEHDSNGENEREMNGNAVEKIEECENDRNGTSRKQGGKKYAVVLNRPPGHHCDGGKYSGYCYINSTAVAIEKHLNTDTKVLVLDIDVHHGDGTQKIFYGEPTVLTVSFHQYDGHFFPSSGMRTEYGPSRRHKAYGTNINVPLDKQASDFDVLYALRRMVWEMVAKFKPDIAFYAVGTDGVAGDKANNSTIFTPSLYGQIAYELTKYTNLIVVTTEGGYTTQFLADGMSCVLHGLTGNIDTNHYPETIKEEDILPSTVHTVAATRSDLRKVYNFEREAGEFERIFNGANLKTTSADSSFEVNYAELIDSDIDFNDAAFIESEDDGDEEYISNDDKKKKKKDKKPKDKDKGKEKQNGEKNDKKKNKEKDKDKEHKKKKKKKKKKHKDKDRNEAEPESRQSAIDLTADDNKKKDKKSKKKKKKDKEKKSKKHKKEKKADKDNSIDPKEAENPQDVNQSKANDLLEKLNNNEEMAKRIVSMSAPKKSKLAVPNSNDESNGIEVIDLIEDSPAAIDSDIVHNTDLNEHKSANGEAVKTAENGSRKKKKKKKKDKDKTKSKKRKRRKHREDGSKTHSKKTSIRAEETENLSDIHNFGDMFTLSGIIGTGIGMNTLAIQETHPLNGKNFVQQQEEEEKEKAKAMHGSELLTELNASGKDESLQVDNDVIVID